MIEIIDIKKSFKQQEVLKGVSLTIEKGTIQTLLGANGAGKTTLINIVSGLMKSNGGEIKIDDEIITIESYKHRSKVGYVFEEPVYVEKFTAREQLEFLGKMFKIEKTVLNQRINELLNFFELPNDKKKYIESYSKGMKSKVSLAMALLHNPKYLILDEPFDGIDFVSVQNISKLLRQMASNGVAISITSHQYDVIADMGTKFALLKDGQIMFNKTFGDLKLMASEFNQEANPVKAYLESLMVTEEKKGLSWIK